VFLLGTGNTARQVRALTESVEEFLREKGERRPLRREGTEDMRWVVLDYGDLVVHLFEQETRAYYDLERLWADAPRIAMESVTP
ncbi:MAG: ribosome silencing factor, partial [Acidimicrobiia bacterium]|nr:ribosome silencing factor [Acidimicrobiia bacterium]